jgi:hypothetical protein
MKSNKTIYILFTITFIWLLILTVRSGEYVVSSSGGGGAYLVDNRTGEAWLLISDKKRKVKED